MVSSGCATSAAGTNDAGVLECARKEARLLLTFDKDCGELAFRHELGRPAKRGCPRERSEPVPALRHAQGALSEVEGREAIHAIEGSAAVPGERQ
jgi:hypothetical protein